MPVADETATETATNVKPLLTNNTILILSGFLIGIGSGQKIQSEFGTLVFLTGIVGLIAYIALTVVVQRRKQRVAKRAIQEATCQLERRMDRHIPTAASDAGGA